MSAAQKMMKETLEHIAIYSSESPTRKLCVETLRHAAQADEEERRAFNERADAARPLLMAGAK